MEYELSIENTPEVIPSGAAILLLHPSTGGTDRVDTDFLSVDTDHILIVSTRTTAPEIRQKLEFFGVDPDKAVIIDTLSVERGYSRRPSSNIHYLSSPEDLSGIITRTRDFLRSTSGKRRISVDSITELMYFAGAENTYTAIRELLEAIDDHDAVGLFHLAEEVHDPEQVERYQALFHGVITLTEDGMLEWHVDDS